jgi:hypothetical protein
VHLGADVMGNKAHDTLAIGGGHIFVGLNQAFG